jgi:hypothetical protein
VPPLDPLFIPDALLDYNQGNMEGKMIVRNSKVYGLKGIEILDFRLGKLCLTQVDR